MLGIPRTETEAQAYRYGCWAGEPKGRKYNPLRCAYEMRPKGTWITSQCSRDKGYGPGGLFCKQHAKIALQRAG